MKTVRPNVLDVCLHKAGFKSTNNPEMVAGLFKEFRTYETQEGNEYNEKTCAVMHKNIPLELDMSSKGSIYLWDGSGGETAEQSLFFVELMDSTIEMVKPDYTSGSNYAYTETIREAGETISECVTRIGKKVKRVVHIVWDYKEWNELERARSVTIYS